MRNSTFRAILLCHFWPVPYFSSLSHKRYDFREEVIKEKIVFCVIYNFVLSLLILRRIQRDTVLNIRVHRSSFTVTLIIVTFNGKGKGFPLQDWNGSWGSRRLRLPDLLEFQHSEGGKVVTLTHRLPSLPGVFLVLIFRGRFDPRAHGSVGSSGKNPQRHHWESIPRPSD